jgi:hypothetical protein
MIFLSEGGDKMFRKLLIVAFTIVLVLPALFADQADQVFSALTAKNDKEVTRLLQNLALARDFAQLDKIQAKNPELFGAMYFPGDFMSKIIFNYVENAASGAKTVQAAKGTANPNSKGTWQWYLWDLDKALTGRDASKDQAVKKTLQAQIDNDVAALGKILSNSSLDAKAQLSIGLYLYAYNMNSLMGVFSGSSVDPEASIAERLNAQFGEEAATILGYLFKAGVPFPDKLPASLKLAAWNRERMALEQFIAITKPETQSEFETKEEFGARSAEVARIRDQVVSTEINRPATLTLGQFNVEGGYFSLSVDAGPSGLSTETINSLASQGLTIGIFDLDKADIRYYLERKNAPFFKDKGFAAWTASVTIAAGTPGSYNLKELVVKNGKDTVTDGLWGFRVRNTRGSSGETIMRFENYVKGREYDFSGTKVTGLGASIPIAADGNYVLSGAAGTPAGMWKADLTALWAPTVGGEGLAGGIVFYDKGEFSDGWRYLEAAPNDQSGGIQWYNGNNIDITTGTAVGTGKANTEAIIAAQGSGNYAATLCKNLSINGFSDWFLPSMDELDLMFKNLKKANLGGFGEGWLWSSSQTNNGFSFDYAWGQGFSDGSQHNYTKNYKYSVRAVRAF